MSLFVTGGYWPGNGVEIPEGHWEQQCRHEMAAVSEGLCPVHREPLEAVAMPPHRIAGHCTPCCRFWGINLNRRQVGWWLDHDPLNEYLFSVPVPDWMRALT